MTSSASCSFLEPPIDLVVSSCSSKDAETWRYSSILVSKFIPCHRHVVIVPSADVPLFKKITPIGCTVVDESIYTDKFYDYLRAKINASSCPKSRIGWYVQQFVKLMALSELHPNEIGLIWDADTLPIKHLRFIDQTGCLYFYTSREKHEPYFNLIHNLLKISRLYEKSFIAQCIPAKGQWIADLVFMLESRNAHQNWIYELIDAVNFREYSGFSEYELLGNFFMANYPDQFQPCNRRWSRAGQFIMPSPSLTRSKAFNRIYGVFFDFIAFEKSSSYELAFRRRLRFLKEQAKYFLPNRNDNYIQKFLEKYFTGEKSRCILQVGSNDGIQDDYIREHLINNHKDQFFLVEPLPYYVEKLKALYNNYTNVSIVPAAVADMGKIADFYYIDPEIADEMNGDGPMNDWAHGQGSFDISTVRRWIIKNSFRGKKYRKNIDRYIGAIKKTAVDLVRIEDIIPHGPNTLLCIDVQGAVMNVVSSLGESRPKFIIIEDDMGGGGKVKQLLLSMGYKYKGGKRVKLYEFFGLPK